MESATRWGIRVNGGDQQKLKGAGEGESLGGGMARAESGHRVVVVEEI